MPAQRLDSQSPTDLPKYSIIACYSDDTSAFVQHVAILREKASVKFGDRVPVFHAAPPIVAGGQTDADVPAHVGAYLEDLSLDEMNGIATALARIDESTPKMSGQSAWKQYVALPSRKSVRDKRSGKKKYQRFSCSGFVEECYEQAGILLVTADSARMPDVPLSLILTAYPDASRDRLRKWIGLDGSGPWPVTMAGYIVNSLDRDSVDVRNSAYEPESIDDAYFPSL